MFEIGNSFDPKLFERLEKMLKEKPITMNNYRLNSGKGKSQCWGIVKQRNSGYAGSRWNMERPDVYRELLRIASVILPVGFSYLSIQVNQDYQTLEHKDKGNKGLSAIIGFGDYSGGDLNVEGHSVSIKNRVVFFDGSLYTHSTEPWEGKRYSLVYHTPDSIFECVPSYSVEERDGDLVLREEMRGLVRLWKKGLKCIWSSDGNMPIIRKCKPTLMECL